MDAQDKIERPKWMEGSSANSSPPTGDLHHPWRLVLLGAPGVGKGTQGELLCQRLEICHISTGDLFRAAGSRKAVDQTPAMAEAMKYMRHGDLVPDSTVWELVQEQSDSLRSRKGFLLDGFPRTLAQAERLKLFMDNEKLSLTAAVDYEMPQAEITMRLSGRRICAQCKSVFHVTWRPPKIEGVCDDCGGRLYQREDDHAASIAIRLEAYKRSTAPLIQFYKDLGLLTPVDAVGSAEEVFARTMAALQARA
jgi:adenylate kinase